MASISFVQTPMSQSWLIKHCMICMAPAHLSHFIPFPSPPSSHTIQLSVPGLYQPQSYPQGPGNLYGWVHIFQIPFPWSLGLLPSTGNIFIFHSTLFIPQCFFLNMFMHVYTSLAYLFIFLNLSRKKKSPWRQ